jgi:hypothetical protein
MAGEFDPYYKWLGIPPKDQPPNYYRLLGVEIFEADPEVIAIAAEQRILLVRSFQSGEYALLSQKLQKKIDAAKKNLLDSAKKAEYDISLRLQLRLQPAQSTAQPQQSRPLPTPQTSLKAPPIVQKNSSLPGNTDYSVNPVVIARETLDWMRNHKKVVSLSVRLFCATLVIIILLVVAVNGKGLWTFIFDTSSDLVGKISGSSEEKPPDRQARIRSIPGNKTAEDVNPPGQRNDSNSSATGATARTGTPPPSPNTDPLVTPVTPAITQPAVESQPVKPAAEETSNEIAVLNLPSGKIFNARLFKVNIISLLELLKDPDKEEQTLLLEDPLGRICILAEHKQGVLDGISLYYNERRLPSIYATYADGQRDGFIKTWNEKGERVYWCQYEKGARNGFCCFFKADNLRMLLEIEQNKIRAVHLCANGKLDKSFNSVEEASADKDAQAILAEIEYLEADMKIDEDVFIKKVKDDYLTLRREKKAAATNARKKIALQNYLSRRVLEKQSLVASLWQYKGW